MILILALRAAMTGIARCLLTRPAASPAYARKSWARKVLRRCATSGQHICLRDSKLAEFCMFSVRVSVQFCLADYFVSETISAMLRMGRTSRIDSGSLMNPCAW